MKTFFRDLKIRDKLFFILFFVSFSLIIVGVIGIQLSFRIYEEQLYQQVAETSVLESEIAEMKWNEIDKMSFDILSSNVVQEYLAGSQDKDTPYERYEAFDNLCSKLLPWAFGKSCINSINIVDKQGNQFVWGRDPRKIPGKRIELITDQAEDKEGGLTWIEPHGTDSSIIAARMIRSIPDLELFSLGTLIIRMDPEKLLGKSNYRKLINNYDSNLVIFSNNRIIYQRYEQIVPNELALKMNKNIGYFSTSIQEQECLVSYVKSQHTNWRFTTIVSYSNILKNIAKVRTLIIIICISIFCLVIYFSLLFLKGLTKPLERLTNKIRMMEEGQFDKINKMDMNSQISADEIAQLEYNFNIMAKKINTLINDNYLNQIVIKESQFKALQAQINPHFLYNTLESINWLAKLSKHHQIATMVKALGNLLRNSISNKKEAIPLKEEMEILEDYITIQKCRYEERLDFSMNIHQDYLVYMIPKLSLQPLVENSIQHGLEKVLGVCEIRVGIDATEHRLKVWVQDNGPGMDNEFLTKLNKGQIESKGSGIGIKNIDERIKIMFGEEYGLEVESTQGEGTKVYVCIPYKRSEDFV